MVLFILISGLIPLFLVGWFIHRQASATLADQHSRDLANLAASQSEVLESHIKHIVDDAELLAINRDVRAYMDARERGEVSDPLLFRAGEVIAQLQDARWGDIHHVMLCDPDGSVVLNPPVKMWSQPGITGAVMRETGGVHQGQSVGHVPGFQRATTETVLTDLFGFEERDHYHQLVMTPVIGEGGETLGVLCIEIVIGRLLDLLNARSVGSDDAIFLATLDGVRVVERKDEFDATRLALPGLVNRLRNAEAETGWFRNLRGERVLAAYYPSEAYPWVVCVEKPQVAAMGSAGRLTRSVVAVLGLGLAALTLLAYIIGSAISRPISKIVRDSALVSGGRLDHEIRVTRRDELGVLQGSVDRMRRSMKVQIDHLDALVAERTSELEHANERLARDAREDRLTGLANHHVMLERIGEEIDRFRADPSRGFALLFFDFDRFKVVNDSLGHTTGDELLCSIAARFRTSLRHEDLASRFGGDEFVVMLADTSTPGDALASAQRLLSVFAEPHEIGGHRLVSTASIGFVYCEHRYGSAEEMLRDADAAMYGAKSAGRGQVMVFDEQMHAQAQMRLRLEHGLDRAIERGELRLVYQPVIQLDNTSLKGFEALVRWHHPEHGLVRPDQFIPIAEDTGQIVEIGTWVLNESLRQLSEWDRRPGASPGMAMNVNVSKRQLIHPEFLDRVRDAIDRFGIEPSRIYLEITETTAIDPRHDMPATIRRVKELGVNIAMDDFGTGHSSLSLLHHFDLDVIKVDKSFIQGMEFSRDMAAVLHAVITLAQNMGKLVVAEGVETPEQVATLISLGCEYVQGYYFSKPLEPDDAERFIYASRLRSDAA